MTSAAAINLPVTYDGNREYSNPAAWRLKTTGTAISLVQNPTRPIMLPIIYVFLIGLYLAIGKASGRWGQMTLCIVFLQPVVAYFVYRVISDWRKGPYLFYEAGTVTLPRLGRRISEKDILAWEVIEGQRRRSSSWGCDFNVIVQEQGTPVRLPVAGGMASQFDKTVRLLGKTSGKDVIMRRGMRQPKLWKPTGEIVDL